MSSGVFSINYEASETMSKFHQSEAFVRGVRGPIGSGKSVGCCFEIFRRMREQKVSADGLRKSRWAIIRNTNSQLETTTLETWLDWFPEAIFGKLVRKYPMCHKIRYGDIQADVWFVPLDKPDDVKKVLSFELTGAWINEAREVPKEILDALTGRVGRYPSMKDGGCTWSGILMDTNPPDEDHWWAVYEGSSPLPEGWTFPTGYDFFIQPPAVIEIKEGSTIQWVLNKEAENLKNLPPNYYTNFIAGKKSSVVRVYAGNKFGTLDEGKAIYGESWNEDIHLSKTIVKTIPKTPIHVGLDFGRTPAACFSQISSTGQWRDIHELVCQDMGAKRFGDLLQAEIKKKFPEVPFDMFHFWGDPAGGQKMQSDERTYFDILKNNNGIKIRPSPSQNPTIRREAGEAPLNRMVEGLPGYILSPTCLYLKKGFNGGFRYRRLKVSGEARYEETPEKNIFSHIHEARQYAYCGAGEASSLLRGKNENKNSTPIKAKLDFRIFG